MQPAHDDFAGKVDFVILTIREDENRAVLKRFPKDRIHSGRHRQYSLCRFPLAGGDHYWIAVVRSIVQGEGHAQDVARDAIEDLDPAAVSSPTTTRAGTRRQAPRTAR